MRGSAPRLVAASRASSGSSRQTCEKGIGSLCGETEEAQGGGLLLFSWVDFLLMAHPFWAEKLSQASKKPASKRARANATQQEAGAKFPLARTSEGSANRFRSWNSGAFMGTRTRSSDLKPRSLPRNES